MPGEATCPDCHATVSATEIEWHLRNLCKAKQSKYRVAAKAKRTDADGIVYDSALEMKRAVELKGMKMTGEITDYIHHVRVRLGDLVYETDFLVIVRVEVSEWDSLKPVYHVWFEDTKGAETREFKRVRKLWSKYMKLPLIILKRSRGGGWERETVTP